MKKKDPAILEALFSLSFFSFSSGVTHAFPSPIKGKAGHHMKRDKIHYEMKPTREVSSVFFTTGE